MSPSVQARALETRARLIEAGRTAFSLHGHDAVNPTSDILEPAGVSVGSLYHQFADKTELMVAVLDEAAQERENLTFLLKPGDSARSSLEEDLARAVERFFVSLDNAGSLWRIQVRERNNTDPRIRERILEGRRAWQHEITKVVQPHNRRDGQALDQAVGLIFLVCVGLIAVYPDLPPDIRTANRHTLPARVSAFLCRGVQPLLAAPCTAHHPSATEMPLPATASARQACDHA
jgi:AcrR family transcriptional regulator